MKMPFIKQNLRKPLLTGKRKPQAVGELCFLEYSKLMEAWRKEPRWTTVHNEFKRLSQGDDTSTARFLAFLEFYMSHGHPYEIEKKNENGDI